jgi:hypothetical protein
VVLTDGGGRERRTIGRTKKRDSGRRGTRPEAREEIGGTSLAFFEPADTGTESSTSGFLRKAVVQLSAERDNVSGGLGIGGITSGATTGGWKLAFNTSAVRLATASGNKCVILSVRKKDDFGSVPERRRLIRREAGNCRFLKIRRGEKGGVVTPEKRTGIWRSRESNHNSVVITGRERMNSSGGGKGSVTNIHENMIDSGKKVEGRGIKGKIRRGSTSKGSIYKGSKNRKEMRPSTVRVLNRGAPIMKGIGIRIPIAN